MLPDWSAATMHHAIDCIGAGTDMCDGNAVAPELVTHARLDAHAKGGIGETHWSKLALAKGSADGSATPAAVL